MPKERLSMRKIREVLRLTAAGVTARQVAKIVGVARSTVADCLRRCAAAGLCWPLPEGLAEDELTRRVYPPPPQRDDAPPAPDWPVLHAELSKKGVTLMLLWQEYRAATPDGYQYSRFCDLYRAWAATQDVVLRQAHAPGDKLFVDYAGQTVDVIDQRTGEIRAAQIFVAVLGHSAYTYAEATWTQSAPDWLGAHVRALEFLGGAPGAIVPDNLKAGVSRAHRYDPDLNPSYQELAEHYGLTVLPARVRKPRDKAKVESGVLLVERWILARLRHQTFFALAELNQAITGLIAELNAKPFQKREGSRASVFAEVERPALQPLPAHRYEYAAWKKAKVHLDYHVEVERHYYSVPHALVGKTVEVRLTAQTVEIFHRGSRVAAHVRSQMKGSFTTLPAHRPERHRAVVDLTHERLLKQAEAIGPATASVIRAQALTRKHPEYALRAGLGVLRLAKDFSPAKLEAACVRALALKSTSYRAVRALIQAPEQTELSLSLPAHGNVRGSSYYH
ncbi:MAG: IS21 family transposase [Nevskiaceae bacterium]